MSRDDCAAAITRAWAKLIEPYILQGVRRRNSHFAIVQLSHRFYSEVNTAESLAHTKNIAQNSDPIYGEGFRRVRAIAERVGWLRFIETLQRSKRLPN